MYDPSPPPAALRAVIFDYGEVLCSPPTDAELRRMAAAFDLEVTAFVQHYFEPRAAYDRGDLTAESYWARVAAFAGKPLPAGRLDELRAWDVEMWSHLNPAMLDWLRELLGAGFRVGLLSNMPLDMVRHTRQHFRWIDQLHHLTLSHEVGRVKPEPEIYRHCLDGLGVPASAALFIDDREANVEGARALGIAALRFRSLEQLVVDLRELGFAHLPG